MPIPKEYSFILYLSAKKSVDDRALNCRVRDKFAATLLQTIQKKPVQILELGAGIGTMVERMIDWGLASNAEYTAIDANADNIEEACDRLRRWALGNGFKSSQEQDGALRIQMENGQISVTFINANVYDFFENEKTSILWDLGLAHAFMDLVDIAELLPRFCSRIRPGGLLYLTLNYDGETILLPVINPHLDKQILRLYNQSMDERRRNGKKAGDSQTGRHLFQHLQMANADILAAGSSDWVVFPSSQRYTPDEAYFLHFIVDTIYQELKGYPSLDGKLFENWINLRHTQVETGKLIFIAKQLDILARLPGSASTEKK